MSVDPRILELCEKVTAKRPRTVIDFILKHGQVTTDDLLELGYAHAPRAARDVREQGVPLETISVTSERSGRRMAAYVFGDPAQIKNGRIGGRKAFSKPFKDKLIALYGSREAFTNEVMEGRYLQIDHRVPYEVAGDGAQHEGDPAEYMLLDASSQRAKSWSCEACENWKSIQDEAICRSCLWAFPEAYTHIAMREIRRVDLQCQDEEVAVFEALKVRADAEGTTVSALLKSLARTASGLG
ncbi:hypothetical protein ACSSV6_003340 [Roseovarius sp. MBR-38]|jgi:hypothetical protein